MMKILLTFMLLFLSPLTVAAGDSTTNGAIEDENGTTESAIIVDDEEEESSTFMDLITPTNIILTINIITVTVFVAISIYLRVQLLAQKLLNKEKDKETADVEARLAETENQFKLIMTSFETFGDMLMSIVRASKLAESDKSKIMEMWVGTKSRINDFVSKEMERLQKYTEDFRGTKESVTNFISDQKDVLMDYVESFEKFNKKGDE